MKLLATVTAAAAFAVGGCAVPAAMSTPVSTPTTLSSDTVSATQTAASPSGVVYGWAWSDGQGHLRIVPKAESFVKQSSGFTGYQLKDVPGAEEVRLDYGAATFGRVTVECGLKETEGNVALDAKGLGRTACTPADLTDGLERGPVALRAEYRTGKATRINEILVSDWPDLRTATGTIQRVNDTTVLLSTGGKQVKLGYSFATAFYRTTAGCGDGWLTGRPVNADKDGLGKKQCSADDLTAALAKLHDPVRVKVDYTPGVDSLEQVWEVFGDA
ncbi:hypothetical protein SAMN05421874_102121 [Nonomuraea maritima]|uniref:META domain-containing protein n=1 Tax=Nonomuraea maritima TaxID=683260 RepID=A0A1G8UHL7_9ACTN|nr:hypothetical protein [Nonomuraea maritima]SDJ53248.1 hypothetical protein SAMN05421874_102121 [Nonomuraea maritima]